MTDYVKITNFASKDTLPPGDPLKKVKGTELNDEFVALQAAIGSKLDKSNPAMTGTPTAPTPAIDNSSTQLATTKWVRDLLNAVEPLGTIKSWAGALGSIPSGWALCNGTNGTLNLTDRFIAGFGGGAFGQNTTGGYNAGSTRIPNEGSTFSAGVHSHGGSTDFTVLTEAQLPPHTHGATYVVGSGSAGYANSSPAAFALSTFSISTGSGQAHNHGIVADGAHVHSFDGTTASSPVPGFFALAFIQKIALL
jgi:hypothetical protein